MLNEFLKKVWKHIKLAFAYDKLLHVFAGLGVMVGSKLFLGEMWPIGFLITILIALAKEFYDLKVKKTEFNFYDVAATVIGSLLYLFIAARII